MNQSKFQSQFPYEIPDKSFFEKFIMLLEEIFLYGLSAREAFALMHLLYQSRIEMTDGIVINDDMSPIPIDGWGVEELGIIASHICNSVDKDEIWWKVNYQNIGMIMPYKELEELRQILAFRMRLHPKIKSIERYQ